MKKLGIAILVIVGSVLVYRLIYCDVLVYYDLWGMNNYTYKPSLPYKFPMCVVNPTRAVKYHRAINEYMRENYDTYARYHTHVKRLPEDVFERDAYSIESIKHEEQGKHILILFDNSDLDLDLALILDKNNKVIDIY